MAKTARKKRSFGEAMAFFEQVNRRLEADDEKE